MERKNDRTRKEKEERVRGKPSRQEKERERAEKAREKEMQKMEKKQVKLDKEKDRLERERQRTLQRQAELEEMKGRLCVMDPARDQAPQTRAPSARAAQPQGPPPSAPKAAPAPSVTLAAAQEAIAQCQLEVNSRSSMRGAQSDCCPEDRASDVSFGDDSTSVTDDLTSANIASLERANEQLRLEVEKREGEYRTLQDEVRTLSSKVARLRQQNAADTAAFNQELEGGGASGGVEVEVGDLEKTVQDLEQRIVQMESAGDLLAESMETAAIGKWQSLEGEEVVGQQLSDMVDQMKAMLHQASSTPIRLPPPFLPPPKIPIPASPPATTTLPLQPHPSGTGPPLQKTGANSNSRSFEKTYSHAMKLQVQMNNLRLSQLERNKEILLIKQQLLLQEVNNVLMQASIRRREKDLHHYALARKQQQQAAHLKRWNTFSVQGTNASRPPLLFKPLKGENEGTTASGTLPAKRTKSNLPATTTTTTTTSPTTAAATTAGVSSSPTEAKPTIQNAEEKGMKTAVTSTSNGYEQGGGQTPLTSTNQDAEKSGAKTPVTSTNQRVEEEGVEASLTSTNQGVVEENIMQTPLTSTKQGMEDNDVEAPVISASQGVKENGVETPVAPTDQRVEESDTETPLVSTHQEVERNGVGTPVTSDEHDVKTPVTSTNQGVEEKGVETTAASTEDQRQEGSDAEKAAAPAVQHVESNGLDTQATRSAQDPEEHHGVMNSEDISAADEGSLLQTPHAPCPVQLATSTTTATSTATATALTESAEDASTTAEDSEKSTPGTPSTPEVSTTPAAALQQENSSTAAESSLDEEIMSVSATSITEKDVTVQDSMVPALKSEDVKMTCADTISSLSAENTNMDVPSVSDSDVEHPVDSEALSDGVSCPHGPDDSRVTPASLTETTDAVVDIQSEKTAQDTSAAISSAVTSVTLAETSVSTTTTETAADTKDASVMRQNMTDGSEELKTSTSWQQNASDQQQQQQQTEQEHVVSSVSAASNKSSGSSARPEVCLHKALQECRRQTSSGMESRARRPLSSSSTSLHAPHLGHASRARRLKPATALLQESQRYRSGQSVYSTRIMNRYLPSRSPQPGSPATPAHWDKEAHSRRVCRDGVPLRSPGSSGASSSLSLHRADSPTRTQSDLASHVSHKLSSSGYLAAARLGKPFSSCSTMAADLPSTDPSERAVSGADDENNTTPAGQAVMATPFSASASSRELPLQGSMPEGERSENTSPAQDKQSTPHISSSVVDSDRTEHRRGDNEKTAVDSVPDRGLVSQDSDAASLHRSENTPTASCDPTLTAGGEPHLSSDDPSKNAVSSEPVSAHVTTETKSSSPLSDVTKGQVEGKKKSRSKFLNISWLQKPKKFFTASK